LRKKFLAYISAYARGEIFSAPCIWANSEFIEVPLKQTHFRHAGRKLLPESVSCPIPIKFLESGCRWIGDVTQAIFSYQWCLCGKRGCDSNAYC